MTFADITIGVDPDIFSVGGLTITWHGVFTALAVLTAFLITLYLVKREGSGITEDDVYAVALWAIPGGIVGARLVSIFDDFNYYLNNPGEIVDFQGLGVWGAILGGAIVGVIVARLRRLPVLHMADLTAPGMLVAMMIGRIGCLINGDAYGTPTGLPWGIVYTNPGAFAPLGLAGHPAPVYEMMWDGVVLAAVWQLRRIWPRPAGFIFLSYFALYSLGRFFISYLRENPESALGLQQAQIISIITLLITVPLTVYLWRRGPDAEPPDAITSGRSRRKRQAARVQP